MLFTEGRLREYECTMKEKPVHDRRPIKTTEERDCKHCLYFDEHCHKCSKKKCALFMIDRQGTPAEKESYCHSGGCIKKCSRFLMFKSFML